MAPRARRASPPAPVPAPPRPPPPPPPAWFTALGEVVDVQTHYHGVGQIGDMVFHLPPMQRPIVWTPAQQLALVDGLWRGLPVAPVIVWEDRQRRRWLLDGQQRMTAIGADVRTADGVRRPAPPTRWDWQSGAWSLDAGAPMTLASLGHRSMLDQLRHDDDEGRVHAMCYGMERACWCRVSTTVIGGWGGLPADRVIEAFAALATPGVPWNPDEIAAMVRACADWTP